jgi:preprotein translocase subunit SecE
VEPVQATPTERTIRWARDVQAELKKVVWPSRQQMVAYTIVVVASTALVGVYLFACDFVFHTGIQFLVP